MPGRHDAPRPRTDPTRAQGPGLGSDPARAVAAQRARRSTRPVHGALDRSPPRVRRSRRCPRPMHHRRRRRSAGCRTEGHREDGAALHSTPRTAPFRGRPLTVPVNSGD